MIFQFNTNITEKDLYHFNMFHHNNNKKGKIFWLTYFFLFALFIYYDSLLTGYKKGFYPFLIEIIFFLMLITIIYLIIYKIRIPIYFKVYIKYLVKKDVKNNLIKRINMTFEDDKLVISSKKNKSEISYESILKLEEDDKYFFIYTTPNQAIVIKKDLFKDKFQIDEFRNFIKSKITS